MWFTRFLLHNLVRRKIRSALSCSGVAVAVAALVALRGISDGFERSFAEALEHRGVDVVVTEAGVADLLSSNIPQSLASDLGRLPGVNDVAAFLYDAVSFPDEGVVGVPIFGWNLAEFMFTDLSLAQGRWLQEGNVHAAMLGHVLAANLRKGVGDLIVLEDTEFLIVGIFKSLTTYENGAAVVPLADLQEVMYRPGEVTGFSLDFDDGVDPQEAVARVAEFCAALPREPGKVRGLEAMATKDFAGSRLQIQAAHAVAWATSMVAMLVGMLGVLNTMSSSVFERAREIGILRALGWKKSRVFRMVLGESLLLTVAGACLGTLLGLAVAFAASRFRVTSGFIRGDVALVIVLQCWVITLMMGLLGGLYPAWFATRLAPTEAIRRE